MRICLGKHPTNGTYGLWITKPGTSVLTAATDEFLFDPSRYASRLYLSGYWDGSLNYISYLGSQQFLSYQYNPNGEQRIHYNANFEFSVTVGLSPRPAWLFAPNSSLTWIDDSKLGVRIQTTYLTTRVNGSDARYEPGYNSSTGVLTLPNNIAYRGSYAVFANAF